MLTAFFDSCTAAGLERSVFAENNQTSAKLQSRLDDLYEHLRAQPLPISTSPAGPGMASALRGVMAHALYAPAIWPIVAQGGQFFFSFLSAWCSIEFAFSVLADAERGNGIGAYSIVYAQFVDIHPQAPDVVGANCVSVTSTNICS